MPITDHPNNAEGMPMLFPAWVDRLQMKYMNPVARRVARIMPTFAIIAHRGRKSGKPYETVVQAYRRRNTVAILLGHGQTDWVKNVMAAGEADVRRSGKILHITKVHIVPAGTRAEGLPLAARLGGRRMGVLVGEVTNQTA
jgi:deazaflavin-dependent oxidoreductase (nitroreductase family)